MENKNNISDLVNRYCHRVCNCDFLRFRAKPSLDADILDEIPEKTKIIVDEKYSNKVFYKVEYGGRVGYCVKTFVEKVNI